MATATALRSLPHSLLILFFICIAAPVWSVLALASPATVWQDQGAWAAVLLIVSYWIMPPAMAIAIVMRSPVFLPVFVSECLALMLYVSIYGHATSDIMMWGRYTAIGLTAMAGVFVSSKDLIAPFLSFGSSEWRSTPRLASSIRMHARLKDPTAPIDIVVDDFSMAGMAISLNAEDVDENFELRRGAHIVVSEAGKQSGVGCEIAWVKTDGPLISLGLKALDHPAMSNIVSVFRAKKRGLVLPFWLGRLWLNTGVRRTTMVVWAGLIIAAFGSPACTPKAVNASHYSGATPPLPGELQLDDTSANDAVAQ